MFKNVSKRSNPNVFYADLCCTVRLQVLPNTCSAVRALREPADARELAVLDLPREGARARLDAAKAGGAALGPLGPQGRGGRPGLPSLEI